jgi:hypothetical protein
MSRADDLADIESSMLAMRGMNNAAITASKVLTASETGFLLVDATAAPLTLTLPPANRSMDVRVQRVDNTGNRVVVQATGAEKVLFHTHLRAAGYPFFVLMGAGDFWHLRSDGNGNWRLLNRLDATPLGRPVMETTTAFQPGGWAGYNGWIYNRVDWPWAWDHAQASGMLTTEALRTGKEGCWTDGDGASTFRSPEARAEFLRVLDESRGVDTGRTAGSSQGDAIRNITASASALYIAGSSTTGAMTMAAYGSSPAKIGVIGGDPGNNSTLTFNASLVVPTAAENRPRSIANPGRIKLI